MLRALTLPVFLIVKTRPNGPFLSLLMTTLGNRAEWLPDGVDWNLRPPTVRLLACADATKMVSAAESTNRNQALRDAARRAVRRPFRPREPASSQTRR